MTDIKSLPRYGVRSSPTGAAILDRTPNGRWLLRDDVLAATSSAAPEGLDVERIVRLTVHTCRGRLLVAPADQEAAVKAALAVIRRDRT